MIQTIDDVKIDAITIEPALNPPKTYELVNVSISENYVAIKNILEQLTWGDLYMCAKQSADGIGFGHDGGEALFAGSPDLEPDIESFEGVIFIDFLENQVVVSEAAFWRLMDRFFNVLISMANDRKLDVREDSRWQPFLEHATRIKQLADKTR